MKIWLGFYHYYTGNWEHFLRTSVFDTVRQVIQGNLADKFFFVRYWENGPHIRLRFKGQKTKLLREVKPLIEKAFQEYLKEFSLEDFPVKYRNPRFVSDRTLIIAPYEPEIIRYGGEEAMAICENQFQNSSEAVFQALIENSSWNYSSALGIAIQMHIAFAVKAGMNNYDAYQFFTRQFQNWLPSAIFSKGGDSPQELNKNTSEVLTAFSTSYEKQRNVLEPFAQTIYQSLKNNMTLLSSSWYLNWCDNIETMHREIILLKKKDRLFIPKTFQETLIQDYRIPQEWYVYDSLCHMTNNRLGILNQDEGFLGFILARLFKVFNQSI